MGLFDAKATVDIDAVNRALDKLGRFGRDLSPVFKEARKPLMRDQNEHKKKQEGPDGRWPRRSSLTMARGRSTSRKTGRKRRAGRLLGKLPTALRVVVSRDKLAVISRVSWSGVHQDGAGRVGRAPRIPKRTFLWASRKLLGEIADIIVKQAERNWP